ncbi:DUF1990 family protein [Quadrisphaera sp. DSM 44207]|uniref:DUF1990 family protein n=1 Tax=Quadrisphaera sp. DSM 44207 TaxID=1881057 RepID=UPI0008922410|nr:DUF1990 domain-containing protein [Quadrisphaera sp. DSM 44207]SDQ10931.1 Uncharacterized protein, UPF0548 family [Quadrisphaera sp. DSM 44207]
MLSIGRPSPVRLQAALEHAEGQDLTYPEVGATAGDLPSGYAHVRREVPLGRGEEAFARAAEQLLGWRMHSRAGLLVRAGTPAAQPGTTVVLAVPLGPLWRLAPCRVVRTVHEPDRRGFAYGTLPGHPERGEEAFVVERAASGAVVFRLTVFSALQTLDARVLPPLSRAVQRHYTRRYLTAMRDLARGPGRRSGPGSASGRRGRTVR